MWEALERYGKPIREKPEGARWKSGTLHLAQAESNGGRRGRKRDVPDAERLVKRLVSRELTLSFVPDAEQRLWRTVTRRKYQFTRDHVRLQNQLESLLEEAHMKLSSRDSDLLGASARRMLKALAEGETNPMALASLADERLRATSEQLCDALGACTDLKPVYRRLLKMALEQFTIQQFTIPRATDRPAGPGDGQPAPPAPGCSRAAGKGAGPGSGFGAADHCRSWSHRSDLPSEKCLSCWVGACSGDEESAGVNYSHRSPQGNATCGAFSTRRPVPQSRLKELFSRLFIVVRCPVWDTNKLSGGYPSTRSADWVDPAPGSPLRRTRPSRHQSIQTKAHCNNDPATPKPRLSDRTTGPSKRQSGTRAVIFDAGISAFHRPDGGDEVFRWSLRARPTTAPRRKQHAVLSFT